MISRPSRPPPTEPDRCNIDVRGIRTFSQAQLLHSQLPNTGNVCWRAVNKVKREQCIKAGERGAEGHLAHRNRRSYLVAVLSAALSFAVSDFFASPMAPPFLSAALMALTLVFFAFFSVVLPSAFFPFLHRLSGVSGGSQEHRSNENPQETFHQQSPFRNALLISNEKKTARLPLE
jgi:hypothetical protein